MTTIRMAVSLDAEDLAYQLETDEALAFVKLLDESRGDWDFTLALCDHFDKLRAAHVAEVAADSANRAPQPAHAGENHDR